MELKYQSQASQDKFVAKILNFKRDGFYLDIGSCDAVSCNNTLAFEDLNWEGVCVEIDEQHAESYKQRTCHYIKDDALKVNYASLLQALNFPKRIDYLSLDIDGLSTQVLKLLPFDDYEFSVITIEHDAYIHGDKYRAEQREFLNSKGYILFCANVLVPVSDDTKEGSDFEDWWVNPSILTKCNDGYNVMPAGMYPNQILERLK
jgi:hypothetical protein